MDIFVHNIPADTTKKQLDFFFGGPLRNCGANVFHVEKMSNPSCATLTILDPKAAQVFLDSYGVPRDAPRSARAKLRLTMGGNTIKCTKSRTQPSDFALQSLQLEQDKRLTVNRDRPAVTSGASGTSPTNKYDISQLQCGVWDYDNASHRENSHLAFIPHYVGQQHGHVIFGQRQAIIMLGPEGAVQQRVDINYGDLHDVVLGGNESPTVTFNLFTPPKMFEKRPIDLQALMQLLSVGGRTSNLKPPKKVRLSAIDHLHGKVVGTCRVYRIVLRDSVYLSCIRSQFTRIQKCPIHSLKTKTHYAPEPLEKSFARLTRELTDQHRLGAKPFMLRYQIDRLARNGLLSPLKVLDIIPSISKLHQTRGLNPVVSAIRRLGRDLKNYPPGPSSQANDFSLKELDRLLGEYASSYDALAPDNPFEISKRHVHINLVHKLHITPTGTYLEGPEPEPTNRVLRYYSDNMDHFVRVDFHDEDGNSLRHDPRTDNHHIYHQRFKKDVLEKGILICGSNFSFLGFANSSLRAQSVWFAAPFVDRHGTICFAEHILKELGDFSHIRVPAKCAARIGQNFTDTNATVELQDSQVSWLPVITRNGRDFSDGVGTISEDLLRRVWRVYGTKRLLKPTALQIRFQGCKGMVSLDSRLKGQCLMLRSNMKKYETAAVRNLEICGAGFSPLPMFLNRQLIKVLEDLSVPYEVFHGLQATAINKLRCMTDSYLNTASMLKEAQSAKATKLPDLIRYLGQLGLDYQTDDFLWKIVQMIVVSQLRDVKYKGRSLVEEGLTLYGIMDETGYLRPGEIFVVTEKAPEGGKRVLVKNNIAITRSPVMHPGDVQIVNAVDVPEDSPLQRLRNVVVFSQYGERDLPSQLSGGDLDGDYYNIMWLPQIVPSQACEPADYPRLLAKELDREVKLKDMIDFFIDFCESDQLGAICTSHMILADQRSDGTLSADCIKLAELASNAVDFSKTGIPVDMKGAPRSSRIRPDFMAPGPRVIMSEFGNMDLEIVDQDDDDAFDGVDSELQPYRYYSSKQTLGRLYRNINEEEFLQDMQKNRQDRIIRARTFSIGSLGLLGALLRYIQDWASQYGVMYEHQLSLARDIRADYEDKLVTMLYDYEPSPHSPLTEAEIFAGEILGRQSGAQDKRLKDMSKTMRERFDTVVQYIEVCIIKGDVSGVEDLDDAYEDVNYYEREIEALPRAIACLMAALDGQGYRDRKIGELKSFAYIAAGICLRELERFRITTFGSRGLPPMV